MNVRSLFVYIVCFVTAISSFFFNFDAYAQESVFEEDEEFVQALTWMHERGLTKYDTIEAYRPADVLTRQEAAKFYTQFSTNVLYRVIDMAKYCEFDDLDKADRTLKNYILQSCLLNLFHGSRGNFFPFQQLTKAQALTVLIRALEGNQPEDIEPRWYYYHARASELGLTKEQEAAGLDVPVTRYEIALLLYRAAFEVVDEETE